MEAEAEADGFLAKNRKSPRANAGNGQVPEAEATTTSNDFSRDKLRYVRPGDICRDICRNTPLRTALA